MSTTRLEGMSTPGANKLNRRKVETPSVSRVRGGAPGSSPNVKTPNTAEKHLNDMNSLT